MGKKKIQWHQGFGAALRITLQEEMEFLEMPEDYLAINDFYKVYAYACIYQSNTDRVNEVNPRELTITFVCSHYPRELLRHLEEVRGMETVLAGEGIYYLKGDPIPIQILVTPELSREENYWIQNLRTDLKAGREIRELMERYEQHRKLKDYEAVMDLITRANWEQMEEEKKMCDALNELFAEELKEAMKKGDERGRAAGIKQGKKQGRKQGIEQGKKQGVQLAKKIFRLSAQGISEDEIARQCNIPAEQVKEILE